MADAALQQEEEEIGELEVAEYIVLLLALGTYAGYVEDQSGSEANDDHSRKGVNLVRLADNAYGEGIRDFLLANLVRDVSKLAVQRTFKVRVGDLEQAGRRAQTLRAALERGGAATLRTIFDNARARRAVQTSIEANVLSEPGEAFSVYSQVPLRNARIKAWIREAQEVIGTGAVIKNPIDTAATAAADHVKTLKERSIVEDGTVGAEQAQQARDDREVALTTLQMEATEAAREALQVSGEDDIPPTKSEVIGIATAAAAAATATAANSSNVPESLRRLDPEQRAAALTDGRVLVAAGAGAGKSTTLVSRVKYLVDERGVNPSRVLVSSFNKKAADELKTKIGKAIGGERAKDMQVGTLHGLFKGAINKYGTPEEQGMFRGKIGLLTGSTVSSAVNRLWRKCFAKDMGDGRLQDAEPPSAKQMLMFKTKWSGNGITPAMAKAEARNSATQQAAQWYEMYEGLKGSIRGWRPSCEGRAEATREFDNFLKKNRLVRDKSGREYHARIGDFDDMITVFLDILKRNPEVRQRAQAAFDHVMIDECQDLNETQNQVLELLTGHIGDGSDGKSFWMVGDDKQSIYAFRGARPDIFTGRASTPGWTTRMIRTNYRCAPEIVSAANKLIAHNGDQIPMEANAAPGRAAGEASIQADVFPDEATTALAVASTIKASWDDQGEISDNAILCRTNKELNSYETALLLKGIPYARKGASSFLGSPETKAFLGYITLVTDGDAEKAQAAFKDILNRPNRFFVAPDQVERAVDVALNGYARREGVAKKTVDPMVALRDNEFQRDLVFVLTGNRSGFKADKAISQLYYLMESLDSLSVLTQSPEATTKDMFDAVLEMPGTKFKVNPDTGRIEGEEQVTFRSELSIAIKDYGDEEEDSEQEEERPDEMNLGNISFLYELAKTNPEDPGDIELPPSTPKGFWAKMERLQEKAKELRIDLSAWEKSQEKLPPEERKPAPGVYCGTIHSVKGAQWPNVFVQMAKGRFPMEPRKKDEDEDSASPERLAEKQAELESERRLAYVALTRPSKNLHIVAPAQFSGKPAGMSVFLAEAGLKLGENVEAPGGPAPEPATRAASWFAEDIGHEEPVLAWAEEQ